MCLFPRFPFLSCSSPSRLPLSEFDRHEILLYEEVAKVPPFKRKTLILIGAQGVGRRRLKNKLLLSDPQLFGTTIPCMKSLVSYVSQVFSLHSSWPRLLWLNSVNRSVTMFSYPHPNFVPEGNSQKNPFRLKKKWNKIVSNNFKSRVLGVNCSKAETS